MTALLLDLTQGGLHVLGVLGLHGVGVGLGGLAGEVLKRGTGGAALARRPVVN